MKRKFILVVFIILLTQIIGDIAISKTTEQLEAYEIVIKALIEKIAQLEQKIKELEEENQRLKQQLEKYKEYEVQIPIKAKTLETVSQNKQLMIKEEMIKILTGYKERNHNLKWLKEKLKKFLEKYKGLDFQFEYNYETYTPAYVQALIAVYSESSEEEIAEWKRLISEYPNSKYILVAYDELGDLYKNRGDLYKHKREYKKAIYCYQECIKNRDRFPEVSKCISIGGFKYCVKEEGRQERAIAECFEELGEYQNAIIYWQKYKDMQEEGSDEAIEAEVKIENLWKKINKSNQNENQVDCKP